MFGGYAPSATCAATASWTRTHSPLGTRAAPSGAGGKMTSPLLQEEETERRRSDAAVRGFSGAEIVAGLGAGVLAVLGLAGILPFYMISIGLIAAGFAL